MRIGIDGTAVPEQPVGVGNYIINLCQSLPALAPADEFFVFTRSAIDVLAGSTWPNVRDIPVANVTRIERILWEQFILPADMHTHGLDVFHSPHYTMPFTSGTASVVTFHDMTFFIYPQMHTAYKRVFFRAMIRISAQRAHAIIADSDSTRADILRLLSLDPQRVSVVPLGVASRYHPATDVAVVDAIRRKYHLPERVVLYVGVLEPRKNLSTLIRAFKAGVDRGLPHKLVIVGRKGWMYEELFCTIQALDMTERVVFTGYVPEEELPLLYNAADLFVYPSLYEGFGLPVLEAMACGVPVITSDLSSLPEVVGDAGVLVNPRDPDALTDALYRLWQDADRRHDLSRRGLERARTFTWERTARQTLDVYRQAARTR